MRGKDLPFCHLFHHSNFPPISRRRAMFCLHLYLIILLLHAPNFEAKFRPISKFEMELREMDPASMCHVTLDDTRGKNLEQKLQDCKRSLNKRCREIILTPRKVSWELSCHIVDMKETQLFFEFLFLYIYRIHSFPGNMAPHNISFIWQFLESPNGPLYTA